MHKKNDSHPYKRSEIKIHLMKVACVVFGCLLVAVLVLIYNLETCKIEFRKNEDIFIECFDVLSLDKPEALVTNSDLFSGRVVDVVLESGKVDNQTVGMYELVYSASFGPVKATTTQNVHVVDTTPPVITLHEKEGYFVTDFADYNEEGFVAIDNYDGDISSKVQFELVGEEVVYSVSDSSGNKTTIARNIPYKDVEPPVITLLEGEYVYLQQGKEWIDPGYFVGDNRDKEVSNVSVESTLDVNNVGEYVITYKAQDSAGNVATKQRVVSVVDKNANNVIYLTFDDGPSPYTLQLLDILDKYNVKASFFVVGNDLSDIITEISNRGHVVGAHTYSHKYKIYTNEPTYYQDLNQILDIISTKTGIRPNLIRFPGGSSNTVSANYCRRIMTQLTESVERHGYTYFDWSVNSGDAEDAKTKEDVVNNVIQGIRETKRPVVLQHDTKEYSVAATDEIIKWALENGYIFGVLDEDIICHHRILN